MDFSLETIKKIMEERGESEDFKNIGGVKGIYVWFWAYFLF
jgi:hypothetical protein